MVLANQLWSEYLLCWFPCVVRFGVSLPFDEILKSPCSPVMSMIHDSFYFKLLLASHQVRWGPRVIGAVLIGFMIRRQQTCVEDVMDGPGRRQLWPIGHGGYLMGDNKGTVMLRGQLERLIREGQILAIEPDLIIYVELVFWGYVGHAVESCFCLLSLLERHFLSLFRSWVQCGLI
jgi:hypothetical protein